MQCIWHNGAFVTIIKIYHSCTNQFNCWCPATEYLFQFQWVTNCTNCHNILLTYESRFCFDHSEGVLEHCVMRRVDMLMDVSLGAGQNVPSPKRTHFWSKRTLQNVPTNTYPGFGQNEPYLYMLKFMHFKFINSFG